MRRLKVKFQRINHVFISHLHGDHYLGLIGLLQSMHLLGRKTELHVYANEQLRDIVLMHLRASFTKLNYELHFHPLSYQEPQVIFENKALEVSTVILKHRIPTCGFVFREKTKLRHIIPEKIREYGIQNYAIPGIKEGEDFLQENGVIIPNKELTTEGDKPWSYAYCSDTAYYEKIIEQIREVDLLYHESTFTDEHKTRAKETFHSTAAQAAVIAQKANVKKLLLGHFSIRYKSLDKFLEEARAIFPETTLADDGMTIRLY